MMTWLGYFRLDLDHSMFSSCLASPGTVRSQCDICHLVPQRSQRCEHLWTCFDRRYVRANLGTERPPEKYWRPHFLDPSCRTTPRRGCWHCNKGQRSYVQGTLAVRLLLWCSGTPLDKNVRSMNFIGWVWCQVLLVKEGELTETSNSDLPYRSRNFAKGAKQRNLYGVFLGIIRVTVTSHVSSLML